MNWPAPDPRRCRCACSDAHGHAPQLAHVNEFLGTILDALHYSERPSPSGPVLPF